MSKVIWYSTEFECKLSRGGAWIYRLSDEDSDILLTADEALELANAIIKDQEDSEIKD